VRVITLPGFPATGAWLLHPVCLPLRIGSRSGGDGGPAQGTRCRPTRRPRTGQPPRSTIPRTGPLLTLSLVVPDPPERSLKGGAIKPWRGARRSRHGASGR
jgi:hypothetical protein